MYFPLQKQDYKMALRKYRKALRYLDICWDQEGIDEGREFFLSDDWVLLFFYFPAECDLPVLFNWLCREEFLIAEDKVGDLHK